MPTGLPLAEAIPSGPSSSHTQPPNVADTASSSSSSLPPPLPESSMSTARPPRPLSEISENENRRRSSARQSFHSAKGNTGGGGGGSASEKPPSRPTSEVKDDPKRLSAHLATITLNLNDYASVVRRPASSNLSTKSRDSLSNAAAVQSASNASGSTPRMPSGVKGDRPISVRTTSVSSIRDVQEPRSTDPPKSPDTDTKEGHPLLVAKRLSLRPSPLGASYAEVAKSEPPPSSAPALPPLAAPITTTPLVPVSSAKSNDNALSLTSASPRSSIDSSAASASATVSNSAAKPPLPKSKPSWLRRASGTGILRSKSKSPILKEESLPASTSLPPELPPRKGMISVATGGLLDRAMRPPELPVRTSSYASVAAGPSRSPLGDGAGKPALAHPISSQPSRDNLNIRNRIAAWTSQAQASSSFSRSESSSTIASTAGAPSAFANAQQRLPASAQRMIGSAGSAMQKGWAGFKSRGVGGSISNLAALASGGDSLEPPKTSRKNSRDRSVSAQASMTQSDGPVLLKGIILRPATDGVGKVFGRDISEAGRAWGIEHASNGDESEWTKRRRACLPAVVIRCVDYLEVWGPKEEGIFRISGRSSHVARLRKEFDAGADLNLVACHPGDLDPHAVSGLFKSYLRDLPSSVLTRELGPMFEAAVRKSTPVRSPGAIDLSDDLPPTSKEVLPTLLLQLPIANWFLLADILKLFDLIPRHTETNRMTLNALMLSLGPSLNIPGAVLTELMNRREELFASPPPLSGAEAAQSLIDFGNTEIPPVLDIETISRSSTPVSRHSRQSLDSYHLVPAVEKPKRSPLLVKKPSLTRMFGSGPTSSRKSSFDTAPSAPVVQVSPPRLELRADSPKLPSFEIEEDKRVVTRVGMEHLADKPLPKEPSPSASVPSTPEVHYPAGTVEDRAKVFSTPIADLYSGSAMPASFRSKSSNGSVTTSASMPILSLSPSSVGGVSEFGAPLTAPNPLPPNPATIVRRGQPVFFQSSSYERHGRSQSLAASVGNGAGAGAGAGAAGTKRKDDGQKVLAEEDSEGKPAKRLSAGPGTLGGKESPRPEVTM